MLTLVLAAGLAMAAGAAGANLLINGNLLESPDPAKAPGVEEHTNTWKAPLAVDASVPGFKVTRNSIYLVVSKNTNRRWLDLNGSGGVLQTVAVTPNNRYLLKFTLEGDPVGRDEQRVSIQGAGLHTSESVGDGERRQITAQFTPTMGQTAIEIYATSGGRGPRIFNLSVEAQ
ncbi:MAG: hypothetical protein KF760_07145 [Candidatus Eremiobacteraeota bacterium]|nr:hypothetical protein [Candidatus Eremiobacteraeota bacterium]MCW5869224.1 hypothetical protein [Candidatus Eremiobacteraeota bacterium]